MLDGEDLYVDRNGNGDLTEEGKRFAGKSTPGSKCLSFDIDEVSAFGKEPWPHAIRLTVHRREQVIG